VTPSDFAFVTLAINPIGGLLLAIPFAILQLHYRPWLALAASVPLAYVQVIAVDLLWVALCRLPFWQRLLERRRSAQVERLLASKGGFWITFLGTPVLGPWLVMAFMRYANVPHRRVALPILLALTCTAIVLVGLCSWVPAWFAAK